jgi:zinc protease
MSPGTLPALFPLLLASAGRGTPDRYAIHERVLGNGLRVVTLEDRSCPIVAVQVWYHVGSKDEDPERQGFAHMFEHMMFRGTERLGPEEHFERIRGTGGDCNAHTAFDETVYENELPSNQLPLVLWLEAERMASLRIDEEGFATERKVVEEERRLGLNRPYGSVLEKALAELFHVHPYRWSPIGQIPHLRAATAEELQRFWETRYVPNNATLVVVGDVDPSRAEAEAEKAFGWIPRSPNPSRVAAREPLPEKPREVEIKEDRGPVPLAALVFRTVPTSHPDAIPLDLLLSILGEGESSRLYRDLVDEKEIAVAAAAAPFPLEDDGLAAAGAAAKPLGDLGPILQALEAQIERVWTEPVSARELAKAKAVARRSLLDQSTTVASKATLLGRAALFHGGPSYANRQEERIEAVTVEDLTRVARTYLVPERRTALLIRPTVGGMLGSILGGGKKGPPEDEGAAPASKPAAAARPEPKGPKAAARRPPGYPEAPPLQPLAIGKVERKATEKMLPNGLRAFVVENHEVPLVTVRLGLRSGAFLDLPGKPGSASLAASMLTKGTRTHTAQELAEELDGNAVTLSGGAGPDSASVTATAARKQLGRAVRLLAEVVREPTFPAKEFGRLKAQVLAGLSVQERTPEAIADRAFRRAIFGPHPYARTATGTSEDVKRIEARDCVDWWTRRARPEEAVLAFAGDVDPETAVEAAEGFFGDWKGEGEAPRPDLPAPPSPGPTRILLVDQPGAIQSQIRAGHLGITRADPRYAAGRVLTQVFGGSFGSRLNKRIRIEKGLTYGAGGRLQSSRFAGTFLVSTFSKTPTTGEAVRLILEEIGRMRTEPPTAEELDKARSYLLGSFAGSHETPESIAEELWALSLEGLSPDFVDRYLETVGRTTSEEVGRVAKELLDPGRLTIVVVGDASRVAEELRAIAPVTVVDENGDPKKEVEEGPEGATDR